MIPYKDLCRALDRYRAHQRGEAYEEPLDAGRGGDFDMALEPEDEFAIDDQEILESTDAAAYRDGGEYDVGDITDETAIPPDRMVYEEGVPPPPESEMPTEELQARGKGRTIYGMPTAPPPPGSGRDDSQ